MNHRVLVFRAWLLHFLQDHRLLDLAGREPDDSSHKSEQDPEWTAQTPRPFPRTIAVLVWLPRQLEPVVNPMHYYVVANKLVHEFLGLSVWWKAIPYHQQGTIIPEGADGDAALCTVGWPIGWLTRQRSKDAGMGDQLLGRQYINLWLLMYIHRR